MKPNQMNLCVQAPEKIQMQFLQIASIILLLFLATQSNAQINPQFSPNHNVELCGAGEVYFVCKVPQVPDYIKWDFGDGGSAVSVNPSHMYLHPGKYTVKMYVEKGGVKDSVIREEFVYVKPTPEAKFVMEETLPFFRERSFLDRSICHADSMIKYEWNIGDTNTYIGQNFSMEFPASGKYTVMLNVTNNLNCSDNAKMDIFISEPQTDTPLNTGISEQGKVDFFNIYPNPAKENLFVQLKDVVNDNVEVSISNLCGKELYHSSIRVDGDRINLDVQSLQPGMYILAIKMKNEESQMKFYVS